jgi:hypothetical protein
MEIFINNPKEINKGDMIKGITYTNSQKWLLKPGYEDCNATFIGKVISNNHDSIYDIIIELDNGEKRPAVRNVGTSGDSYIYKIL